MSERVNSTVREIFVPTQKTGVMYVALFLLWGLTLVVLFRAWRLHCPAGLTTLESIAFGIDGVCIGVFSLFGLWHLLVVVFHFLSPARENPGRPAQSGLDDGVRFPIPPRV